MSFVPHPFFRATLAAAGLAAAVGITPVRADDARSPSSPACSVPGELTQLSALPRVARRLVAGQPIKIVAIGSSSTAGAGATSPAASYPERLSVELAALFPHAKVSVINRGANGEEARDMLARFDESVLAEQPDLVIWQVGTNAVLRDQPLQPAGSLIHEGLARLKRADIDVILVDLQYAPKVLAKKDYDGMVDLIALAAKQENVALFHRFAVMRYWNQVSHVPFSTFLSPDELHMNDWSYACFAKLLAGAIADASTRTTLTASRGHR